MEEKNQLMIIFGVGFRKTCDICKKTLALVLSVTMLFGCMPERLNFFCTNVYAEDYKKMLAELSRFMGKTRFIQEDDGTYTIDLVAFLACPPMSLEDLKSFNDEQARIDLEEVSGVDELNRELQSYDDDGCVIPNKCGNWIAYLLATALGFIVTVFSALKIRNLQHDESMSYDSLVKPMEQGGCGIMNSTDVGNVTRWYCCANGRNYYITDIAGYIKDCTGRLASGFYEKIDGFPFSTNVQKAINSAVINWTRQFIDDFYKDEIRDYGQESDLLQSANKVLENKNVCYVLMAFGLVAIMWGVSQLIYRCRNKFKNKSFDEMFKGCCHISEVSCKMSDSFREIGDEEKVIDCLASKFKGIESKIYEVLEFSRSGQCSSYEGDIIDFSRVRYIGISTNISGELRIVPMKALVGEESLYDVYHNKHRIKGIKLSDILRNDSYGYAHYSAWLSGLVHDNLDKVLNKPIPHETLSQTAARKAIQKTIQSAACITHDEKIPVFSPASPVPDKREDKDKLADQELKFIGEEHKDWPNSSLANGGKTCYFATAIQLLYSFDFFRYTVLGEIDKLAATPSKQNQIKELLPRDNDMYNKLGKLFKAMGYKKIIDADSTKLCAEELVEHKGVIGKVEEAISKILEKTNLNQWFKSLDYRDRERCFIVSGLSDGQTFVMDGIKNNQESTQYMIFLEHDTDDDKKFTQKFGVLEKHKRTSDGQTYRLVSAAVHTGGDHYVAFKRDSSGKWWEFSDATVTEFANYEEMKNYSGRRGYDIDTHSVIVVYEKVQLV